MAARSYASGRLADTQRGRDDAWLVADRLAHGHERAVQIGDPAALARARAERQVDPLPELGRQVTALAAQRRQMGAEPARARARRCWRQQD